MQHKKDFSYGVIPVKKFGDQWKVFLIHQYSRIGQNTYWILPKGHPIEDESPKETAERELREETGMKAEPLLDGPQFELKYKFKFENEMIDKMVVFYLGVIEQKNYQLEETEVVEAGWYSLEEAGERLDYKNAKDMFVLVKDFITSGKLDDILQN